MPGALPVLNRRVVELGTRAGHALGCTVQPESIFARKNYFYPDLPKGYQISQYERPLATAGRVDYESGGMPRERSASRASTWKRMPANPCTKGSRTRIASTYLDFNRSGVPLIEIVTEPDLRSAADASDFFSRLRAILVAIGVNDGNMEEGSLRCDANVSVRPAGSATFGTKAEVKNLNSFRHVQRALEFEIARQTQLLEDGGRVVQETRLWDTASGRTVSMRSKEEAHDYRYFPEPDLPPVTLDPVWIEQVRASLPELPDARRHRFVSQYALPDYDAGVLTQSAEVADYFEATATAAGNAKAASNWVMGELMRRANDAGVSVAELPITPVALGALIRLVDAGTITSPVAKEVFETMIAVGPIRGRDRRHRGAGPDRRRGGDRDGGAAGDGGQRRRGRTVSRRQAEDVRVSGGPGPQGDQGQSQSERVNELMRRLLDSARERSRRGRERPVIEANGLVEGLQPRAVRVAGPHARRSTKGSSSS